VSPLSTHEHGQLSRDPVFRQCHGQQILRLLRVGERVSSLSGFGNCPAGRKVGMATDRRFGFAEPAESGVTD
jgi:hypothetical protein